MRSMTGYGRGKATAPGGRHVSVEISSVNRRQSEIALSLPRGWGELEPRLRDEINAHISRGRITAVVALHHAAGRNQPAKVARINNAAARRFHRELLELRRVLKSDEPIALATVLGGPGVLVEEEEEFDSESFYPPCHAALSQALRQLLQMRKREGTQLGRDLRTRLKTLEKACAAIGKRAPKVMERHREQLFERTRNAGLDIAPSDERLLKELIFFADRSDITEELTRLSSHLAQCATLLASNEPVGRTLDFIIQEMNREVNTIGSKANDIEISQTVVDLKTELEKVREQVQNIE